MSDTALAYLNGALDIMQRASINKYQVDWPLLRAEAIDSAAGAQMPSETYPAIVFALGQLGDRHSSFVYPGGLETVPAGAKPLQSGELRAQIIDTDIAWILLPNTYSVGTSVSWQDQAQRLVAEMDRTSTCGWIVDLRRNPGGNMWPMIAAIGPLLGEGDIGSFVTPDSTRTAWFYSAAGEAGLVNSGQRVILSTVSVPHELQHQAPPVAVLIGPNTASAGEAVAVAFHGRPLTRFFGESTAGVPTANSLMPLSDGAAMNLTVGADVDRNGVTFWPVPLPPDAPASAAVVDPTSPSDAAASAATRWLHSQAACTRNP
jgi:C-terminal processing protease CtpA/Prc